MVDRIFERAFIPVQGTLQGANGHGQSMPANVWETPEAFYVTFLLPGADEESISATVQQNQLVVEGELKLLPPEGARWLWREFGPAHFRRAMRLGAAVDPAGVEATYRDGLLTLTLPKAESAKPRRIEVRVSKA
jgi:HSP20 family protein